MSRGKAVQERPAACLNVLWSGDAQFLVGYGRPSRLPAHAVGDHLQRCGVGGSGSLQVLCTVYKETAFPERTRHPQ